MNAVNDRKNVREEKQWSKDLKASLGAAGVLCQMIYRLVDENHELYRMAKSLDMCLTAFYDSRAKAIAEEFGDWIKKVNEDFENGNVDRESMKG